MSWALDLGTTNTGLARWDKAAGQPRLVALPDLCRNPLGKNALEAPGLVPSVLEFLPARSALDSLGRWQPLEALWLVGRTAHIGRSALERNLGLANEAFVPGFKTALGQDPTRAMARLGRDVLSARDAARAFLRELFADVRRETGYRIRDLVLTVPVDAYEGYRAQLEEIVRSLGVRRVRFVDEPLAAALGYGLGLTADRNVLVVDIGGGTMHVALARLSAARGQQGQVEVLGKAGSQLGGNAIDSWVLAHVCRRMGYTLETLPDEEELRLWRRLMLAEACRVKEAVYLERSSEFLLTPPGLCRRVAPGASGVQTATFTRDDLVEVLRENGFYAALADAVDKLFVSPDSVPKEAVDEVLMVGGSTLLPGVFPLLEERFGRHRVRGWQPFEAVAFGAAAFGSDRYKQLDFIVHDYAFMTYDAKTHEPRYTVVVPRGTRFPTARDLWKSQVVPTCSLGEPETLFKLVVCEIGRAEAGARQFVWDAAGDLHKSGGTNGDGRVIVPLNESSPVLGRLDPPHAPRDRRARLEISFGVDENRWLVASVADLVTGRDLMHEQPVVRLL